MAVFFIGSDSMKRLQTVESIIRPILERSIEARNDDMVLFRLVCCECIKHQAFLENTSFDDVMKNYRQYGIPRFESVRRTRQKIQVKSPELGCSPEVRRARRKAETAYRNYAVDKGKSDGNQVN